MMKIMLTLFFATFLTLQLGWGIAISTPTFSGGSGTSEDPYQITTLDDLKTLSENTEYWEAGTYFIQTADIDATATSIWNSGAGFSPIGNNTTPFSGNYDGQNHTISGLYINTTTLDHVGLFGYIKSITTVNSISNLGLLNVDITTTRVNDNTTIRVYVNAGSLAGYASGISDTEKMLITNCYATGSVSGNATNARTAYCYVGGLLGHSEKTKVSCCRSTCTVYGSAINTSFRTNEFPESHVGGLIGCTLTNTLDNCCSTGEVEGYAYCFAARTPYCYARVGGFIGHSHSDEISNCYNTGSVKATANSCISGGLIGSFYGGKNITNCYSVGAVTAIPGAWAQKGGLLGSISPADFYITTISDCIWNTDTLSTPGYGAISAGSSSVSIQGKTTAQMKEQSTYPYLDFDSTWAMDATGTINNGYPYLISLESGPATKSTPVITWINPADITYGTALSATQLNATADVEGVFVYDPAADSVLAVGNNQALTVIFTPTDSENYETAYDTVYVNVKKATPVITWSNPADIIYGTALSATQLNATADVAGTFVYNPAADSVLVVGDNQKLICTFTPADAEGYKSVSDTVSVNVKKATPVITWSNPADIIYGTALSATQLNATADVAGTFVYNPAADSVLVVGDNQKLICTFTPADAEGYKSVFDTVYVNVKTRPMQLVFTTTDVNQTIELPLYGTVDCTVKWGDGEADGVYTIQGMKSHTFATAGTYNVSISESFTEFGSSSAWSGVEYLTEVVSFGDMQLTVLSHAFDGAVNLTSVPATLPTTVNSLSSTFANITQTSITNLDLWDVSHVTNMSEMFLNAKNFNQAIGSWDVSSVTTMNSMFAYATAFDQNLGVWDITSVTDMEAMFAGDSLSLAYYDGILFGWTQQQVQGGVTFDGGSSVYSPEAASSARQNLIDSYSWTITDGGQFKATPTITWSNPADIDLGTALSSTQLNATSEVAGTFAYTPCLGTVLELGTNQELTVIFTPDNTDDYAVAYDTVYINVDVATGFEPSVASQALMVYPNPVSDGFYVAQQGDGNGLLMVTLTDASGRTVMKRKLANNSYISRDDLKSGLYFLSVEQAGVVNVEKLMMK